MATSTEVMWTAADLNRRLRTRYGDKVGYETVSVGREHKWIVKDGMRLPKEITINEAKFADSAEALLKEMTQIARYYRVWEDERTSVLAGLSDEAQTYIKSLYGAGAKAEGVRTFGHRFEIVSRGSGWDCHHVTKDEVVHVSSTRIEIFRYFPVDENRYKTPTHWLAAVNWNHSMYHYVEIDKIAPSIAHERLVELQRRLVNQIADSMYPGGDASGDVGQDIGKKAKDVAEEVIKYREGREAFKNLIKMIGRGKH